MPSPKFRSVSISTEAFDALHRAKAKLMTEGTASLPAGLTPPTAINFSSIILLGVEAIEGSKKKRQR